MSDLADRLGFLISEVHGGSVNRAAAALGVPQQTLQQIVTRGATNPRVSTITAIAKGYGVGVEWLLEGVGETPTFNKLVPVAERLHWGRLLDSLNLPRSVRLDMGSLPYSISGACVSMRIGETRDSERLPTNIRFPILLDLQRRELRMWTTLLEEWIKDTDIEHVRKTLIANKDRIRLGWSWYAIQLLIEGTITKDAINDLARRHGRTDETPGVVAKRGGKSKRSTRRKK